MVVHRLLQAAYHQEPLSGQGAALYGGRWNPKGFSLLYTTESPALSLLEVLVHINPARIPAYYLVSIDVPDSLRVFQPEELPAGWRATGTAQPLPSQSFLLDWLREPASLMVQVPSAIVPIMTNFLINPRHELFSACRVIQSAPFEIDERLYDPTRRKP
ncbi:RES family NAD+ phosphorylase [Fibrella forsythiae]|uniref:RES family NAD+ phosphorylase n=1 Tax=Fibrella forsythiae TaxID=2817061 RepID=A0ABS3JWF1_9BACT|nr:RES family NAD+ phosphorylase [Fibrella forsythiae]MBO0953222.1 RES family NAD+ phosphorylase [Fibrella forsythiae]